VGGRWNEPGLGEWDLRALVGHTARAFVTIESYLSSPNSADPGAAFLDGPVAYYRAALGGVVDHGAIAQRGREAGAALGDDPASSVHEIADRIVALIETLSDDAILTLPWGAIHLDGYLPTRLVELVVHTADLGAALARPTDLSPAAVGRVAGILGELSALRGNGEAVLLALTGRAPLPSGFSAL
jgi:hypothetical protein